MTFLILASYINKICAHQPFKILKSNAQETNINISDSSVSHAFYGEFKSNDEKVIFNLNNFFDNILKFSILIPNQEPENQLLKKYLPEITLSKSNMNEESFVANISTKFYEPYSQMNLIRVISYQENLLNDSVIVVKLRSNDPLRYVFTVGSKEIFSSRYASGETEYFNQSAQIKWYIQPNTIKIIKPSTQTKDVTNQQLKNLEDPKEPLRISLTVSVVVIFSIISKILIQRKNWKRNGTNRFNN